MKKIFSFAIAALMSMSMIALVGCGKENTDEPVWETPTSLEGTEWVDDGGESWLATIYFETETTGRRTVHNVIGGETYDTETPFTYTYEKPNGEFVDDIQHTYSFSIDGGTLTVGMDGYDEVYKRKK